MKSISDTNKKINELLEEAAKLLESRDLNNVGMPWPDDVKIAQKIRKLNEKI